MTREENVIESDSESDDPEDWVDVDEGLSEKMKSLVVNEKRKQRKRDRRRFLKIVAERSVLKRKIPKRASRLLKEFPNLGKEDFVQDNRVGADAWRRTGVATFDGNVKSGPRDIPQNQRTFRKKVSEKVQIWGNCSAVSCSK